MTVFKEMKANCSNMMSTCAKHCRWCPVIPIVLGFGLFLLGVFLQAETLRVLWLAFSVLPMVMGLIGLIMINVVLHDMPKQT